MKKKIVLSMKYLVIAMLAAIFLFPIVYMLANAVMSSREIIDSYNNSGVYVRLKLVPEQFSLEQFYQALFRRSAFLNMFWNSVIITAPVVIGQFIVSSLAAYAFAKLEFPGRDKLFFVLIILLILPPQVTLVPNYIMLERMKLLDSYAAIILPGVFSAFGICLLRQSMRYIPNDICEAAKLDGASPFKIFTKIILPQAQGGVAALIVLVFIDNWNMVEQPLIYLKDESMYPLSIYLSNMKISDLGIIFACGVIFTIPALIIYILCEEAFVNLTYAELK